MPKVLRSGTPLDIALDTVLAQIKPSSHRLLSGRIKVATELEVILC